jgi:hypothetical protein
MKFASRLSCPANDLLDPPINAAGRVSPETLGVIRETRLASAPPTLNTVNKHQGVFYECHPDPRSRRGRADNHPAPRRHRERHDRVTAGHAKVERPLVLPFRVLGALFHT